MSPLYNFSLLKELHLDIHTLLNSTCVHCLLSSTLTRLVLKPAFGLGPPKTSTDLSSILRDCSLLEFLEVGEDLPWR